MPSITDIFAGAGGSSTGATAVPGVFVALAANHWQLAVDVHAANHPNTIHAVVDLHMEDPRNFPKTDMLWASPECTKWSIANSKAKELSVSMGGDPTLFDDVPDELVSEGEDEITRSRLLMFDVLRFIEYHRYRVVAVENVIDIATLPKYSAAWIAWQKGLRKLGYRFRVVSLNSMHAQTFGLPAPQSRDRLYIVAWPENETPPDIERILRPKAWCPRCEGMVESRQAWKQGRTVGRYRAQYVYQCPECRTTVEPGWLPASSAIDWSIEGQLIGERERPLSPKTMARIREGLRRFGGFARFQAGSEVVDSDTIGGGHGFGPGRSLILEAAGNTYDAADPRHPMHGKAGGYYRVWPDSDPLRTLHGTSSKALLIPTEGREGKQARPDDLPFRTQTTRNELGILTMLRGTNAPKLTTDALDTLAAGGNHHGLLVPSGGTWHERAYTTGDPMRTVTTRDNHGLLVPYYSGSETAKPTDQPIGTLTTVDRYGLAEGTGDGSGEVIDPNECTFRMLEPHEIAAGMAFPATYQWQGTKRERVRLAGNAVTPPAARDIVTVMAEGLDAA